MLLYKKELAAFSRQLRNNPTDAERYLWSKVRMKQISGYQFYRQKPLGKYIVDFYCPGAKLVIEIDGEDHFQKNKIAEDKKREEFLGTIGLKVLRFNNKDILSNIDGVIEQIALEME
jgi:very-short-patch-repair endonuclease